MALILVDEAGCCLGGGWVKRVGLNEQVEDRRDDGERGRFGGQLHSWQVRVQEEERDVEVADVAIFVG